MDNKIREAYLDRYVRPYGVADATVKDYEHELNQSYKFDVFAEGYKAGAESMLVNGVNFDDGYDNFTDRLPTDTGLGFAYAVWNHWEAKCKSMQEENKRLREALQEAMEWNWLDDDIPEEVLNQCEQALNGKEG